jgi:long-subunit acyl-CoA synthetase (AMP-forming)
LKRGDTVAISVGDAVLHLVFTLGLTHVGIVTLSGAASGIPPEIPVSAYLVDAAAAPGGTRSIVVDAQWMAGDGKPPAGNPDEHDRANVARIVRTSGTTGQPKGIALTHDMIARRVGAFTSAFGNRVPQCSRLFVDVGLASSYGFQWIVWLLSRGGAVFLRGTDAAETMQGTPATIGKSNNSYWASRPISAELAAAEP